MPETTASVAPSPLLDQVAAAAVLAVSPRSLERWRVQGAGPPFVKVGGLVRYRPEALAEWIDSRTVSSTSQDLPVAAAGGGR